MKTAEEMRHITRTAVDRRLEEFEKDQRLAISELEALIQSNAERGKFEAKIYLNTFSKEVLTILAHKRTLNDLRLLLEINGYELKYSSASKIADINWWPKTVREDMKKRRRNND